MLLFQNNKVEGKFIRRVNRFIAEVEIKGVIHRVHVPNTGRLKELLVEGAKVILKYHPAPHKKTSYSLILVEKEGILVCIDSRIANDLYYEYLLNNGINEFSSIEELKREVKYGNSRFDIGFSEQGQRVLIEIKSVNLVMNSHAMFPDAPTTRGTKHVKELMEAQKNGIKTGIVFVVQRPDASIFSPHWQMDKNFSESLEKAYTQGVMLRTYVCNVNSTSIDICKEIPMDFNRN